MFTEKANAICLLQILSEFSDENHILRMKDIIQKMNVYYGLAIDRRTVYGAFTVLCDLGYDISMYEENGRGYYLRQRMLEPGEVRLLMDAVYAFSFIPARHTQALIGKLQKLLSVHERKQFRYLTVVRPEGKTPNRQVFYSIERLDEAIAKQVQVSFTYLQYDVKKRLMARRKEKYTVNPFGMLYTNEHYYLVCVMAGKESVSMYRIDRMSDVELTECPIEKREQNFDIDKVVSQALYAFSGVPEEVVLRCDRFVLDHAIDRFGMGIRVQETDDGRLELRVTVSPRGVKFWALQYLPYVEVLSPVWLRTEIMESIDKSPYLKNKKLTGGLTMTEIQGVYFEPYIGPDYEKMQKRVLILGESHYHGEINCYTIKGPDKTLKVADRYLTGEENYKFLSGALCVLNGAEYEKDNLRNYAFYNYVQSFVAGGARSRPERQQWKEAEEPFINVLKTLKPDIVLCCGKALYNHLPDDPDKEQQKDGIDLSDGERHLWCREYHYHIDGKDIMLLGIHHPCSAGFSGLRYHDMLASYFMNEKVNKEGLAT